MIQKLYRNVEISEISKIANFVFQKMNIKQNVNKVFFKVKSSFVRVKV